jgi:hypothetical protein
VVKLSIRAPQQTDVETELKTRALVYFVCVFVIDDLYTSGYFIRPCPDTTEPNNLHFS